SARLPGSSSTKEVMRLWKGPGAIALTVMFSAARCLARWRVSMCTPALAGGRFLCKRPRARLSRSATRSGRSASVGGTRRAALRTETEVGARALAVPIDDPPGHFAGVDVKQRRPGEPQLHGAALA